MIRNALLAVGEICFVVRVRIAKGRRLPNGLSFKQTVIAPGIAFARDRRLCLSCCYNWCWSIAYSHGDCENFLLDEDFIWKAVILRIHIEVVINYVETQT